MNRVELGEKVEVLRDRGIDGWETRPGHVVGIYGRWPRRRYGIALHPSGLVGVYRRSQFSRTGTGG
jgi:hypothetical protein